MSDIQQGPDWWLASDGRWYPPSSRPDYAVAPLPSRGVTKWVQIIWWTIIPLGLATAGLGSQALNKAQVWERSGSTRALDDWVEMHEGFSGALGLVLMFLLANFVLVIIWMNAAYKYQNSFGPAERRWSSGWTIGAWFIPIANFIIPKLVLNEIERVAAADHDAYGQTADNWRQTRLHLPGHIYWLAWVASSICFGASTLAWDAVVDVRHSDEIVLSQVETFYQLNMAGSLLIAIAGLFAAMHFRYLAQQLTVSAPSE